MLTRVWGEINGLGMVPAFVVGDRFYFTPPDTLTGRYVCQFWAEDEYGNITNETALLTIYKGMVKCIEVLSKVWAVTLSRDPWEVETIPEAWDVKMVPIACKNDMVEVLM